jgi:predicted aminopeptidase
MSTIITTRIGILGIICMMLGACGTMKFLLDEGQHWKGLKKQALSLKKAQKDERYHKYQTYFKWVPKIKRYAHKQLSFPSSKSYQNFHPGAPHPYWRVFAVKEDIWHPKEWRDPIWIKMDSQLFFDREILRQEVASLQSSGYEVTAQETWILDDGGYVERLIYAQMMSGGMSIFVEHLMKGLFQEFILSKSIKDRTTLCPKTLAEKATSAFLASQPQLAGSVLKYQSILREMSVYRKLLRETKHRVIKLIGSPKNPIKKSLTWKKERTKIFGWLGRKINSRYFKYIRPPIHGWNNALLHAELSCK